MFLSRKLAAPSRYELYTAIKGPFGTTKNLHPFPEIDVTERFPEMWAASDPAGLCTGDNSALLAFRAPRHDFWGGSGDLELLTIDGSLLDGDIAVEEVKLALGGGGGAEWKHFAQDRCKSGKILLCRRNEGWGLY